MNPDPGRAAVPRNVRAWVGEPPPTEEGSGRPIGCPEIAPAEVVAMVRERGRAGRAAREAIVSRLDARRG